MLPIVMKRQKCRNCVCSFAVVVVGLMAPRCILVVDVINSRSMHVCVPVKMLHVYMNVKKLYRYEVVEAFQCEKHKTEMRTL